MSELKIKTKQKISGNNIKMLIIIYINYIMMHKIKIKILLKIKIINQIV